MHTVGLDIPISISHGIEAIVVLTITEGFVYTVTKMRSVAANAEAKGGRVRPETLPTSFFGRITTRIHTLAMFIPPLVYVGAVVFNGLSSQIGWTLQIMRLPLRVIFVCKPTVRCHSRTNAELNEGSRKVHSQHLNYYTCTPGAKVSRLARKSRVEARSRYLVKNAHRLVFFGTKRNT
ncbi:hypothetical protein PAXINDRAFT_181620 [Paxillus involutus ATCC 200175]|uniref:Uncharacterized protein n=1 Tax=Paxillus involutus ATCC 200175 TaxID=664439 RepID=A0A0C9TXI5_PAXIN|nr:hypothetical protein PAXINDRAFT_181620 [Paxillus involutus ATCC 200175]